MTKEKNALKYELIYKEMKQRIIDGVYPINQKIPDGKKLAEEFSASVLTVKKALDILVKEGYIVRRRGDGSFVQDWTQQRSSNKFHSLSGTSATYGNRVKSKIIEFTIEPSDKFLSDKLAIKEKEYVYKIIRLRIIDEIPSIIEYTWMPIHLISGLDEDAVKHSIYQYIKEELQLKIKSSYVRVSGVRPSVDEKNWMKLTDEDFLMQVEQIAYLDDGKTFEYSIAKHLPEEFHFESVLST